MLRYLLSASVVWAVGCIIPANLQPEPDSPPNARPQVLTGVPDFLMPIVLEHDQRFAFQITVRDIDVRDALLGRLRRNQHWDSAMDIAPHSASNDGVERIISFGQLRWCEVWGSGSNVTWSLQAFVSDNGFPPGDDEPLPDIEHSDFKSWTVVCK